MKTLSKGQSADAVFKLIKVLFNIHQSDYEEAVNGDTAALNDIAETLEVKKPLFSDEQANTFNKRVSAGMDEETKNQVSEDEIQFYKSANIP